MENRGQTERTETNGMAVPAILAVLAAVAFVHAAWWLIGDSVVAYGNLVDSDGYARLIRIQRLIDTAAWFDVSLPRADWPYGGSLHWTRPLDVILIVMALPGAALVGFDAALYWAGVLIGPLLHGLAALVVMWAARPLCGPGASLVAGLLAAIPFGVLGYATVGHADHHMLVGLLSVAAFGFTVRALIGDGDGDGVAQAFRAGLVLAFGIWVGTEVQVTAGLCFGVLALQWAVDGGDRLDVNRRIALGLMVGLAAALVVERGLNALDVQYDRLSIVHLTLAVLVFGFWAVMGRFKRHLTGTERKLAAGAGGAAIIVAVMVSLFPKVLLSPLQDVAPVLLKVFASVAEYAPVSDAWHFLVYAGGVVLALPYAVRMALEPQQGPQRWGWLLLAASLGVYTLFAVQWIRWSLYVGLFGAIALAHLLEKADVSLDGLRPGLRTLGKAAVLGLIAIGPFTIGMAGMANPIGETAAKPPDAVNAGDGDPRPCPVQAASRFLNRPPWGDRPRMILTSANDGAELLYRTPHRVMGTLHHPNARGIVDSIRILGSIDGGGVGEEKTLALMRARQVDLVLVCRNWGGGAYRADGRSLFERLLKGDAPGWLKEISLPEGLGRAFLLYKVAPE